MGDADKLVTLFTATKGKVKAVARGARRMRSRFGVALEPFTHCSVVVFVKPGDQLARMSKAEIVRPFFRIREDLDALTAAGKMAALVNRLAPEHLPLPRTFDLFVEGLWYMEERGPLPILPLYFTARVVGYAGFEPRLDSCIRCRRSARSGEVGCFSPWGGGFLCGPCAKSSSNGFRPSEFLPISPATRSFLRYLKEAELSGIDRLRPTAAMEGEAEAILSSTISAQLGKARI